MSNPFLLVFGPSSPPEEALHKEIQSTLVERGWSYKFVSPSRYLHADAMHNCHAPFHELINTDCFLIAPGFPFISKRNSDEYANLALQWISGKPKSLRQGGLYGEKHVASIINQIIDKCNPSFCLIWGDHRPFSLLALDIVAARSINHARIDRAFIPNSYKLFKSSITTSIAIGNPNNYAKRFSAELEQLSSTGQYIYKEASTEEVPSKPYVLFLGASDIDVGIYKSSRFKNSILLTYKSSLHAYHDIRHFLWRFHRLPCFYRPHPNSPSKSQQNIHCSLDQAIKSSTFVIGTPSSTLIRAYMLGKRVICIGRIEKSDILPFPQVDSKDAIYSLVTNNVSSSISYVEPDFERLSIYASSFLFGVPSALNNNLPLSVTPLVAHLEKIISHT